MKNQLEQYFGCKVKIAEYKNKLPLPIFMTMRDIMMVEIYGVSFAIIDVMKETELSVAAMKKQKVKYEEALQCPVVFQVTLNSVSMRNALVKIGVPFVDLPGNVFLIMMLATRGADLRPGILLMLRGWLYQSLKNLRTALRVQHRST